MKIFVEVVIFLILTIIFISLFFYLAGTVFSPSSSYYSSDSVCFKEDCFLVKVAKTDFERYQGLMFQKNLPEDEGMFFVFEKEDIHLFWMKNTLIPLDMIWINKDNKVVFINKNTQPCLEEEECPSIDPRIKAKYVLEINAGASEESRIKIGDTVKLNIK